MNIKELAEQAGMLYMDYIRVDSINQLEKFADLVAAHEREECAKVCESFDELHPEAAFHRCSAVIRARGQA
jgi:hypothetical protein